MSIERETLTDVDWGRAHIIRFNPEDAVRGFYAILTNGQAAALPNDTYVVGDAQLELIRGANISYEVLNEEDI